MKWNGFPSDFSSKARFVREIFSYLGILQSTKILALFRALSQEESTGFSFFNLNIFAVLDHTLNSSAHPASSFFLLQCRPVSVSLCRSSCVSVYSYFGFFFTSRAWVLVTDEFRLNYECIWVEFCFNSFLGIKKISFLNAFKIKATLKLYSSWHDDRF